MNFKAKSEFRPVDLVRLQAAIIPKVTAAVSDGCAAVVEEAQAICPVGDTGVLHDSIHTASVELRGTSVVGVVVADAPYASFVEYGTGIVGESAPHPPLPTAGVPFTGGWVYDFRNQNWIGMASRAFMRPGLDAARGAILAAFRKRGFRV